MFIYNVFITMYIVNEHYKCSFVMIIFMSTYNDHSAITL